MGEKKKKIESLYPVTGTVFFHGRYQDRPCMVVEPPSYSEDIFRVDVDGMVTMWGTIEDWVEAIQNGDITIVWMPAGYLRASRKKKKDV